MNKVLLILLIAVSISAFMLFNSPTKINELTDMAGTYAARMKCWQSCLNEQTGCNYQNSLLGPFEKNPKDC